MMEASKDTYYCGSCLIYVRIEDDMHGAFCQDMRDTKGERPPARLGVPP